MGEKNKSFPSLPPAQGGELLFILKSVKYALFHPRWHYLLVILICLALPLPLRAVEGGLATSNAVVRGVRIYGRV